MLASRGLLSGAALHRARRLEAESGERIDHIAAKLGLVSERHLAAAYAELIGSPVLDPTDFPPEPVAAERLGRAFLKQARVIPLAETALVVAMAASDIHPSNPANAGCGCAIGSTAYCTRKS